MGNTKRKSLASITVNTYIENFFIFYKDNDLYVKISSYKKNEGKKENYQVYHSYVLSNNFESFNSYYEGINGSIDIFFKNGFLTDINNNILKAEKVKKIFSLKLLNGEVLSFGDFITSSNASFDFFLSKDKKITVINVNNPKVILNSKSNNLEKFFNTHQKFKSDALLFEGIVSYINKAREGFFIVLNNNGVFISSFVSNDEISFLKKNNENNKIISLKINDTFISLKDIVRVRTKEFLFHLTEYNGNSRVNPMTTNNYFSLKIKSLDNYQEDLKSDSIELSQNQKKTINDKILKNIIEIEI